MSILWNLKWMVKCVLWRMYSPTTRGFIYVLMYQGLSTHNFTFPLFPCNDLASKTLSKGTNILRSSLKQGQITQWNDIMQKGIGYLVLRTVFYLRLWYVSFYSTNEMINITILGRAKYYHRKRWRISCSTDYAKGCWGWFVSPFDCFCPECWLLLWGATHRQLLSSASCWQSSSPFEIGSGYWLKRRYGNTVLHWTNKYTNFTQNPRVAGGEGSWLGNYPS